ERRRRMPAMVAAIVDPNTRQHIATHRTYLEIRDGRVVKADLEKPKKVLGAGGGGVIPLTRGASGKGLGKLAPGEAVLRGGGVGSVRPVAQWHPERRALAYVSAGNLASLDLPEAVADIVLVRDRDGENQQIETARRWTMAHWQAEGRRVAVWEPPEGFKDANDFWQAEVLAYERA